VIGGRWTVIGGWWLVAGKEIYKSRR